jgi:enediyne biosynthesis protein E11
VVRQAGGAYRGIFIRRGTVAVLAEVLADLAAEGDDVDQLVAAIEPEQWQTPTPAPGWTIAHQVGHLESTDRIAALAVTDPVGFAARRDAATGDFDAATDAAAAESSALPQTSCWAMGRCRPEARAA